MSPTVAMKPSVEPKLLLQKPNYQTSTAPYPRRYVSATDSSTPMMMTMMLKRPKKLSRNASGEEDKVATIPASTTTMMMMTMYTRQQQQQQQQQQSLIINNNNNNNKKSAVKKGRPRPLDSLPQEVLDVVVDMVQELHGCATCRMRDLCALCLCSRNMLTIGRRALYRHIRIDGPDAPTGNKKSRTTCRMTLLRQTLRTKPDIAGLVRRLKLPRPEAMVKTGTTTDTTTNNATTTTTTTTSQYHHLVLSLVMACPNLQRLDGPVLSYGSASLQRLIDALATRSNLRHLAWLVEHRLSSSSSSSFVEHHRNWSRLSSLSIQYHHEHHHHHGHVKSGVGGGSSSSSSSSSTTTTSSFVTATLKALPAIQHLHLSCLPASAFDDAALLALPKLRSLTLSSIVGVTTGGLASFATRPNSESLRKLHLRHTPLTSLPALARILSNLGRLVSFALVQEAPPLMPDGDEFVLCMMPYLASLSLLSLHWHLPPEGEPGVAHEMLARSIRAGGFPRLTSLRAPSDPGGLLQNLCRPTERAHLPDDGIRRLEVCSAPSSPTKRAASASSSSSCRPFTETNLVDARLAAQSRIESARAAHRFRVHVQDEAGRLVESFGLGGYVGTLGSPIHYHLLPDCGSSHDRGGLVDVPDLFAGDAATEPVCDGSWNRHQSHRERWWHASRPRCTTVSLD